MILYIFMTVFIAGLMVGRTPEYLGKKIGKPEVLASIIGVLFPSFVIMILTSIAVINPFSLTKLNNLGPHGFSEILYAYSSGVGNNGSAFAGLTTDNVFFNTTIGIAMIIGRYIVIIPVMFIAGSMSIKKTLVESAGTFKTDSFVFLILLLSIILIVGALNHFPSLILGPILEHLYMINGIVF